MSISDTAAEAARGLGVKAEKPAGGVHLTAWTERGDATARRFFTATALISLVIMTLIMIFLFQEGLGLFKTYSITDFLFTNEWYPTDEANPAYGILALIMGSIMVTLLSSLIAIPLGVGSALYLSAVARPRVREWVKPGIELLASLPSVVLGFVGMIVIAPFMQKVLDIPTGLNILNASFILALMAIPTISSISEDAMYNVPKEWLEASYALGANRWETVWNVWIPGALSGMGTGVVLGMARAMGETMVVLMVAGGAAQIPTSLFQSARPLPATIAAEMGETPVGTEHYFALFAIGIVLFLMTLAFSLLAAYISKRFQMKGSATL
ncbi:MAG: phosphate ABC transporter permease subunit PstC [Proteobacteria bacterium]|nr:phosphate ABC transporter permease subunit PstC [Pseudomonadota bacterium]